MKFIHLSIIIISLLFCLPACKNKKNSRQDRMVMIGAASNLSYVMPALEKSFKTLSPAASIKIVFGSSGKLFSQIKHNAPFDLFMAADMDYPKLLFKEGLACQPPCQYAEGQLILFTIKNVALTGLEIVRQEQIKNIAVANYKVAPYGKAALEALQNSGYYIGIESKLNNAKTISGVLQFVFTASDIGFIARSALYSEKMSAYQQGKHWIKVDPCLYQPIKQGIVLLKRGAKNQTACSFYDFILSKAGRDIFIRYGYQ